MVLTSEVTSVILPTPYIQSKTRQRPISWNRQNTAVVYGTTSGVFVRPLKIHDREGLGEADAGRIECFLKPLSVEKTNEPSILTACAIAPDDQLIVAGDDRGTIYFWQRSSQSALLTTFYLPDYLMKTSNMGCSITDLAFSPDSHHLAVVTESGGVLFSLEKPTVVGLLMGYGQALSCVAFSKKSPRLLVTCNSEDPGRLWFHDYEKSISVVAERKTDAGITCLRFSHDGEYLAATTTHGSLEGWCTLSGEKDREIKLSTHPLLSFCWAPDNEHIALCGTDATIRLVDFLDGTVTSVVTPGTMAPCIPVGVAWNISGWIVALCDDGSFHGFKSHHNEEFNKTRQFRWTGLQSEAQCLDTLPYHAEGLTVAADLYGSILFLTMRTSSDMTLLHYRQLASPKVIRAVRLFNTFCVVATLDGTIFVVKVPEKSEMSKKATEELMCRSKLNSKDVTKFLDKVALGQFSKDTASSLSVLSYSEGHAEASIDGPVCLAPLEEAFFCAMWCLPYQIVDVLILDEEHVAAVFTQNGEIVVFSLSDPLKEFKPLYTIDCHATILSVCTTPDGALVALALTPLDSYPAERLRMSNCTSKAASCMIEIYEIGDATTSKGFNFIRVYDHVKEHITAMAFNPAGRYLATADVTYAIQVVDLEVGKMLIQNEWRCHTNQITALSWHSQNHILCSCSLDAHVGFFNAADAKEMYLLPLPQSGGLKSVVFVTESSVMAAGRDGGLYGVALQHTPNSN